MKHRFTGIVLTVVVLSMVAPTLPVDAQVRQLFDVRAPMRDGIELSADVWLPGDGEYPAILVRTPYLKSMMVNDRPIFPGAGAFFASHGYALVVQDVRGRGDSDGVFDFYFADAEDGYDTVEWIASQPWSNGDVGMMGVSYLGAVQWLAASQRPPHLKCIAPTAPSGQYMHELPYRGGAWMMAWSLEWINGTSGHAEQGKNLEGIDWDKVFSQRPLIELDEVMGRRMPLYRDFITNNVLNGYWKRIILTAEDFRRLDIPAMTVTGWFDGDQPGALHHWTGMAENSPAADSQFLIIGPWNHVQTFIGGATEMGDMEFTPDSIIDNFGTHLEFFDHYLKGEAPPLEWPRARVYVTGLDQWREYDEYPPAAASSRALYLASEGAANGLDGDGTLVWSAPGGQPTDVFTFDPQHPVPSDIAGQQHGIDRRPIQRRDDVLVYTSGELKEAVEITGPVTVELYAATDAPDTDFTATLTDVYPDGRAVALGIEPTGIIRARYRHGLDRIELVTPGSVERYTIDLSHIGHAFLAGHRIRLEISSSAYPAYNPNQNTGNPVATDTEWHVAGQTIHHDQQYPSRLILPVVPNRPSDEMGGGGS